MEKTLSHGKYPVMQSLTVPLCPLFHNCCILYCGCPNLTCNIVNLIVTICDFLGALHLEENEGSLRWVKVILVCGHKYRYLEFFGDYNG